MSAGKRRGALVVALLIIGLPPLAALTEFIAFTAHNRDDAGFISSGEHRTYVLHVPPRYAGGAPVPLVISLHGAGLWGAGQRDISGWNAVADREGFIVAYPTGAAGSGPRIWRTDGGPRLAADVRFIADLVDTLSAHYAIDQRRIFVNGFSNGGGMAFALSCTLGDRIAAVGLVGAAHLLRFDWCPDRRPVPVVSFHGTDDRAAPYRGGTSWVAEDRFPSIPDWTAKWARRNGCAATAGEWQVAPDIMRIEYPNCANGAGVLLYRIDGGGHTWPGGDPLPEWFVGRTTQSISATDLMWEFFRRHPLQADRLR